MPTTGNHRKRLTQKEQEVLELIKHGKSNADIAAHMNITERLGDRGGRFFDLDKDNKDKETTPCHVH